MSWSVISSATAYPAAAITGVVVQLGDLICLDQSYAAVDANPTVSDNAAGGTNSYSQVGEVGSAFGTSAFGHSNRAVAKASETLTITSSLNPSDSGLHATVARPTAGLSATPEDGAAATAAEGSSGTAHNGGSVTPTAGRSIYVHTYWFQETADVTMTENGGGFTKESEVTNHVSHVFDQIVASASGSYADITTSNVAAPYNSITQAYLEGLPSGPTNSPQLFRPRVHLMEEYEGPFPELNVRNWWGVS